MLHIALWEPEIPPNTGNIGRMCAAVGARLHLIGKLGFQLDDRNLKRAGLDYWPWMDLAIHSNWDGFVSAIGEARIWCVETPAKRNYTQVVFRDGDCLLFGNESSGLPTHLRERFAEQLIGIPMPTNKVRSLNLATAAGIVFYEALRQVNQW